MNTMRAEGWYKPARCRLAHYFRFNSLVLYPANSHESVCSRRFCLRDYGGTPAELLALRDLGHVAACRQCSTAAAGVN